MSVTIEKLEEYDQKGVANIWVFDPRLEKMSVYAGGNLREVHDDRISTSDPRLELTREEIFQR